MQAIVKPTVMNLWLWVKLPLGSLNHTPTLLQYLREKFPGPESDPGPQLSEEDSSAQVRFDLRQQFRGLPVQPVRVRQQAIIHNLLLRNKLSHIPAHSHFRCHTSHFSVETVCKMVKKTFLLCLLGSAQPKLVGIIRCVQKPGGRQAITEESMSR